MAFEDEPGLALAPLPPPPLALLLLPPPLLHAAAATITAIPTLAVPNEPSLDLTALTYS
jgi:hypothetical protein